MIIFRIALKGSIKNFLLFDHGYVELRDGSLTCQLKHFSREA
jgi:hypothetical protein